MTAVSVVLIGDPAGPARSAASILGALARQGLVRPFWFVSTGASDASLVTRFDRTGEEEVSLFASIGERAADEIRVGVIASPDDGVDPVKVMETAVTVQRRLTALAPADASVRVARLWFPDWESMSPPREGFFSTHVDANVVVAPEDRRSDQHFAAPVGPATEEFVGHVAAETAALMGMFSGMDGALLDEMSPGVIFGTNPKVRLARSFVRVGRSPALPLQEIVDHEGRLPVPPGTVEAPSPSAAVADLGARSGPLLARLAFTETDPEPPPRRQLRPVQTLGLLLREMGRFIVSLPRRAVEGLFEDFSELAGRTMQDLVGGSSVVEVVWQGKYSPTRDSGDLDELIADLKENAERRLDLQGGPSIDQAVWRDLRTLVLSTVDGSEPPHGVDPIELQGRPVVVNDPAALAPRPQETLVGTAKVVLDEAESDSPVTLLGRLGARVEQIGRSNRNAVSRLLAGLDTQMAALHDYRPPGFAFWHIAGSVLLAAFVVSLLLLTGAVQAMGITELSELTRNVLFGSATLACASALVLLRSYGNEALTESVTASEEGFVTPLGAGPTWVGGLLGAGVAALYVGLAVNFLGYPNTEPALYAAIAAGVVTGAGLGQAYSQAAEQEDVPALGRMSRLSIIAVLLYASVVVAGAIAQPDGWYATAPDAELSDLLWPVCGTLGLLLFLVLVFVSWRRVQERLAVRWYGQTIRKLASQIDDALTGDRVADAAREQFLGMSAVLSRLVWFPFGKGVSISDTGVGLADFGVNKAGVCQFGLSPRGLRLFETRTIRLASERGWLTSQYEESVQTFRSEQLVAMGGDDPSEVVRPDQDPKTVAQHEPEARPEKGDRWRWADRFFEGAYDARLLHALESEGETEVFGPLLADPANFEPLADCSSGGSLLEFMADIAPRGEAAADPHYFDPEHLASGAFTRTWHPHIWWPREQLFAAGTRDGDRSIDPVGSLAAGAVWVSVRIDSTEDLEPSAIFGGSESDIVPEGDEGPEF